MIFKKWKPNQEMYLNKYGIPEPKKTNETFKPDLVLVPLVGYDEKLNRLGYGAGYYDRLIELVKKHLIVEQYLLKLLGPVGVVICLFMQNQKNIKI